MAQLSPDDIDNDPVVASLTRPEVQIIALVEPNHETCPDFYEQLKFNPFKAQWIQAMKDETMKILAKTVKIVSLEEAAQAEDMVPTRFVFNIKRSGERKARLVAQGHKQYWDILADNSSPTADLTSLRLVLQKTIQENWIMKSVDFTAAYLNASLPVKLYATAPPGFEEVDPNFDRKKHCFRVEKALYGLRASGSLWYSHLSAFMKGLGFNKGTFDSCLFSHKVRKIIVLAYVDDLLLTGE